MLIDWFTVGAQAVNFIVLVWLLKRFLYKPILDAIDAREKRISAQLSDAEAKEAQAVKERDEFLRKNEALDMTRATLLKQAETEAQAERERLLNEARSAADALSAQRAEAAKIEASTLGRTIRDRTQAEVFAITRKALTDLASTSLEESIAETFVCRLRDLAAPAKATLAAAIRSGPETPLIRSAFELPEEQRRNIQSAINEEFSTSASLRFETAPDLIAGIELAANGQKAGWSISDYLATLEQDATALLQRSDTTKSRGP
ncbi:MAG: F0F1 ATP synthase subunit delta [Methylocystis sp.]|jgi:F-type H+-transporting ATPase subunit b